MNDLLNRLLELERGFWEAAGKPAFYDQNLADDGVLVLPGFREAIGKRSVLELVAASPPWLGYSMEAPLLVPMTPDVAAVVYQAEGRREGQEYQALITSVYVKRGGRWLLALHQQTPFA